MGKSLHAERSDGFTDTVNSTLLMDKQVKKFLKQLFCNHIEELADKKYLYSTGIRVLNEFRPFYEYYAYTFRCIKCERKRLEEKRVDII